MVFSYENLDNAAASYQKLLTKIAELDPADQTVDQAAFDQLKERFVSALSADLNTSLAITAVYDVLKAKTNGGTKLAALGDFDRVLGLNLLPAADKIRREKKLGGGGPHPGRAQGSGH